MLPKAVKCLVSALTAALLAACQTLPQEVLPAGPTEPESGPFRAQHWWIPVPETPGSSQTLALEAVVYQPSGPGPFPLIELNHGIPVDKDGLKQMKPGFVRAAHWFVDRGFAVVVPMRRGFGGSQGDYEQLRGCTPQTYLLRADGQAQDEAAVIAFMQKQPFVDAGKVIVLGQSAGGFGALALVDHPPQGVIAMINFAGGMGGDGHQDICGGDEALIAAVSALATYNQVPAIWLYAQNDQFFNVRLSDRMYRAYSQRSKPPVEFVRLPAFGDDGHKTLSQAPTVNWEVPVGAFIDKVLPR